MIARIERIKSAAEEMGNERDVEILSRLAENLDHGRYFVALIGQYSAGKSYLLNNLLERDILPKGVTETTPLLTYIRYGEKDQASLVYQNGGRQYITLDQVAKIRQNSGEWNLDQLDYMELQLNHDMLRNGMILLDTPGVNTVIGRHERLLRTTLSLAAKLVYVTGGPMDQMDREKLQVLGQSGRDMLFVRTHMDEIFTSEENPEHTIQINNEQLDELGLSRIPRFYLSNRQDDQWYQNMTGLRSCLYELGGKAQQELHQDAALLLDRLSETYIDLLEQKRMEYQAAEEQNEAERKLRFEALQERIQTAQKVLDDQIERMNRAIEQCKWDMERKVPRQAALLLDTSVDRIEYANIAQTDAMKRMMEQEGKRYLRQVINVITELADKTIVAINEDKLSAIPEFFPPQLDNSTELQLEQDMEYMQLQDQLAVCRSGQDQLAQSLMEHQPVCQKLSQEIRDIEEQIVELQKKQDTLPPYVPQYCEVEYEGMQPSQMARTIGNLVDWALLLLPGDAIAKGATKLVPQLAKLLGGMEKTSKIIKTGDNLKDITQMLSTMSRVYATKKRKEKATKILDGAAQAAQMALEKHNEAVQGKDKDQTSFLDLLTVEHWAEKAAKPFDHPPRLERDLEYERQYKAMEDEIRNQLRNERADIHRKKCQMQIYRNEAEQLAGEHQASMADEQDVLREMKKRENELKTKAEQEGTAQWRRSCAQYFREVMVGVSQDMIQSRQGELIESLTWYHESRMQSCRDRLEDLKKNYQALENMPVSEACRKRMQVESLAKLLQEV